MLADFVTLFTSSYSLPGWALALLVAGVVPTVFKLARRLRRAPSAAQLRYVEDSFHGATWRWAWTDGELTDLEAFCPQCDAELSHDDSSCRQASATNPETEYVCEDCGHVVVATIPGGDRSHALAVVEREIRGRVRSRNKA